MVHNTALQAHKPSPSAGGTELDRHHFVPGMNPPLKPRAEDVPYLRRLAWTVAVGAVLLILWRAADMLLLAFGSVLGAVLFRSAARLFERLGVRNWRVALPLGMLLSLAVLGLLGWLIVVQFGSEIAAMLTNLPDTVAKIERALGSTAVGHSIVIATQSAISGSAIADRLGTVATGAGRILVNFLIVLVGAVFIAGNPRPYQHALVTLTPPAGREVMARTIAEMSAGLRLWLKSKLISMTLMGLLIGGTLWLAGLRDWGALGMLGGLSEFIPYVGPAVAMLPAIGLAAGQSNQVLLHTLIAYVVVRIVEAWLITPVVNREVIDVPPALTLFTILAAGAVFGIYGMFFAGALLVVAFIGVRELYLRDTLGEDIEGIPSKAD